VEQVRGTLEAAGVRGVIVRRGVEDLVAHEQGVNNEASAAGLVALFGVFARGDFLPEPLREEGVGILLEQEFNRMIPARLPAGVKVAHKTGEISTHAHDAGIVFPPHRQPYLLAVMTQSEHIERRQRAVAEISAAIFQHLVEGRA
jgi:beta-lactamase class A